MWNATSIADVNGACSVPNNETLLPFEDATTPNSLVALATLICVIHVTRARVFQPILRQLGARLATFSNGSKWAERNKESINNFGDFSFRLLFRLIVTGLGLMEFWQSSEWWYETPLLWEGYPHHSVSNTVQILYLLQLAYHLEDLGVVLIEGTSNRKDFKAMMVHHIVTALLLFGSTSLRTTRIGTIVSTLHAITDVPKDFAKVSKTLEWDLASKLGFATLVLTWIGARLYLYPMVYLRSVFLETTPLLDGGMGLGTLRGFQFLLSVLIVLNIMWFHMMIKIIRKLATSGKADDPQLVKKENDVGIADDDSATSSNITDDSTACSDNDGPDSISDDDRSTNNQ